MEERLDRAMAGADWCLLYEHATVFNMEVLTSNHSALFIDIENAQVRVQRRCFMFENVWLRDVGCKDVVPGAWDNSVGDAFPRRLDHCGYQLRRWGGCFGKRLAKDIEALHNRLNVLFGRRDYMVVVIYLYIYNIPYKSDGNNVYRIYFM